jgi:hypothetical protein
MMKLVQFIARQDRKRLFAFLLILWLGMNFFQALFTEIMKDESYYFLYGQNLAWGYFDHPPMVALMTWLSSLICKGNLSVRFVTVFVQFFTLIIIWKLIDEKQPDAKKVALFFVISMSMVMFQAFGFVTTPDVPLLFFASLFLLVYRNFLKNNSLLNAILLALTMAGMIYSKYHTVLIIGCIVLSNMRLLLQPKFWLAGFLTLILLIPHIYWQFAMDFPSFKYHLMDRSRSFQWLFFFEYIPNQLVVFNPFTFGAVIFIVLKYRAVDLFERGLYVLLFGFLLFFGTMSFRGHVEPHWTVVCTIPMIILLYRRSLNDSKLMGFVRYWIMPSIILVFCARIVLMTDCLPEYLDFYGKKEKKEAIQSVAGSLPVVFAGESYQNPSTYRFFTGKESFVLSSVESRRTQFDIWQKELAYQGKPVFICRPKTGLSTTYHINGYSFEGYFASDFQSVNRVKIKYTLNRHEIFPGDTLRIEFEMSNPTSFDIDFRHSEFPVTCKAAYMERSKNATGSGNIGTVLMDCEFEHAINTLPANTTITGNLKTVVPAIGPSVYVFALTLDNTVCCAKNSDFIKMTILTNQF